MSRETSAIPPGVSSCFAHFSAMAGSEADSGGTYVAGIAVVRFIVAYDAASSAFAHSSDFVRVLRGASYIATRAWAFSSTSPRSVACSTCAFACVYRCAWETACRTARRDSISTDTLHEGTEPTARHIDLTLEPLGYSPAGLTWVLAETRRREWLAGPAQREPRLKLVRPRGGGGRPQSIFAATEGIESPTNAEQVKWRGASPAWG